MPVNLVLIGPPGVGKGTQAALLTQRLGLAHIASGNVFRSEIAAGTELGKRAKEFIDQGQLVPDGLTIDMMLGKIGEPEAARSGFVLDGFPRTLGQAEALDSALERLGVRIDRAVSLVIADEAVVARLSGRRTCPNCGEVYHVVTRPPRVEGVCDKCGSGLEVRADDNEATIRGRLSVFHEQTRPVVEYYRGRGLLHEVDGSLGAEDVYAGVVEGLPA